MPARCASLATELQNYAPRAKSSFVGLLRNLLVDCCYHDSLFQDLMRIAGRGGWGDER